MTCQMRHIFMPNDQTNSKIIHLMQQFIKCKMQSHSCCNQKRTHWIVATINPILCRSCVHHGTFPKVLIPKCREIIIFAHNYFRKQNTNQATCCLDL